MPRKFGYPRNEASRRDRIEQREIIKLPSRDTHARRDLLANDPHRSPKNVSKLIRQLGERHVDFVLFSDSNGVWSGHGWDHGVAYGLAQIATMYATGLSSGGDIGSFPGSRQGYGWEALPTESPVVQTGAPAALAAFLDQPVAKQPLDYGYLASGAYTGNGGLRITSGVTMDVNAALAFDFHWGSFAAGAGEFTATVRRVSSTVLNSSVISTNTGTVEMNRSRLTVAAATRNYDIEARWAVSEATGPCFFLYTRAFNTAQSSGFSVSTLKGVNSAYTRNILDDLQQGDDATMTYFFGELRRGQEQADKRIVVVINFGFGDRGNNQISLGPDPVSGANANPLAYMDNLRGLIIRIREIWTAEGWNADEELFFLIAPSHPSGEADPADASLIDIYVEHAKQLEYEDDNVQVFDMRTIVNEVNMDENDWYTEATNVHLEQGGYEFIGQRMFSDLEGTY